MAKSDIEENYDELNNSHTTSKIDVPMTFEHLLYIFSKFRFSIPITITNTYICMKFAKCDGRADGHTDRHEDRHEDRHDQHCLPEKTNNVIQYRPSRLSISIWWA